MRTGRIKWFNSQQSYGYIILMDGTEVYFHSSAISQSVTWDALNPGRNVTFDLIETRVGMEAQNVEVMF